MTSIVLESNGSRPRLLEQTITTLYQNTPVDKFNITYVLDGWRSADRITGPNSSALMIEPPCSVTGRLKNLGAYWSEKQLGRGEWLLFIDDDVAFLPGWLEYMIEALEFHKELGLVGGNRHPYHGINAIWEIDMLAGRARNPMRRVEITDAVAGYSMLMRWETFDKYGPFDSWAKGISQSEDYSFARRIVDDGGKVGYVSPSVLEHCGVTNSSGQPATGAEKIERKEGILYL